MIIEAVGLTFILTRAKLFRFMREFITKKNLAWGEFISCDQCVGFWVGLVFQLADYCINGIHLVPPLANCFSVSLAAYVIGIILNKINR